MTHEYDDILNYQYRSPALHKRMTNAQRAAQFAPFAALSGYEKCLEKSRAEVEKQYDSTEIHEVYYT